MTDRSGRSELHYAVLATDASRVDELLAGGADANAVDKNGQTPLHFAAQSRASALADRLLEADAHVDVEDIHGNTPLWTAVFNSQGDGEVIQLLRQRGADCYHRNGAGRTPVDLARMIANYPVAQFFADLP